jgi:hypothetical protein
MKTTLVLFLFTIAALLIACDKDKFETKPRIEVKDYSSQIVPNNGTVVIRVNYFDKEGDLGTGQLYVYRDRLNLRPGDQNRADTFRYQLPEFTNREQGEIRIQFTADELTESSIENDTLRFKIAVTDLANNHSDTITTENLVILE